MKNWRQRIVNYMQNVGGKASLAELYEHFENNYKDELKNLKDSRSWKAGLRRTLQCSSSESMFYDGKNDLFKRVDRGVWELKELPLTLKSKNWKRAYESGDSDNSLAKQFFLPGMQRSVNYNRGTGFFTSSLFEMLGEELQGFLERGGEMRIVTNVRFSKADNEAVEQGLKEKEEIVEEKISKIIKDEFADPLPENTYLLTKLLEIGRLKLKVAVRNSGIYHEKIGYFEDEDENKVAWQGSANDSRTAYEDNFESIDTYTSWGDSSDQERCNDKIEKFKMMWKDERQNLKVYDFPDASKKIIIEKYNRSKRYRDNDVETSEDSETNSEEVDAGETVTEDEKYSYQKEAMDWYLSPENNGVGLLQMATGTGKTWTALKIIDEMFQRDIIDKVVVCTQKRILDQWREEMASDSGKPFSLDWKKRVYWQSAKEKKANRFRFANPGSCLLITYHFFASFARRMESQSLRRTLLIVDEVHNIGSESEIAKEIDSDAADELENDNRLVKFDESLDVSSYSKFGYRLGLSATPFSEYDNKRNEFITKGFCNKTINIKDEDWLDEAISKKLIFNFGLEKAIKQGVLSPLSYKTLYYEPSEDEKKERGRVFRKWKGLAKEGLVAQSAPYIMAANVFKNSEEKLPVFEQYLKEQRHIEMRRTVIFANNKEYVEKICKLLFRCGYRNYRKFVSGDKDDLLEKFKDKKLEILVTCHMISEGVNVPSISEVILFSSDRQRRETIQRIGRALRTTKHNPNKIANVVDFIFDEPDKEESADSIRKKWLTELSKIRKKHIK